MVTRFQKLDKPTRDAVAAFAVVLAIGAVCAALAVLAACTWWIIDAIVDTRA